MSSSPHSTDTGPFDSEARANTWVETLRQCDFAGQIDLSEDDLKSFADAVRGGFENPVTTPHKHAIRVVFSVNELQYYRGQMNQLVRAALKLKRPIAM